MPRPTRRAWTAAAPGTRTANSLRYGPGCSRGAPAAARAISSSAARAAPRAATSRGQRAQGLVRADVAGGLLTADVLLAGTQGHDKGSAPVDVRGHANKTAGDLAHKGLATGQDAEIRPAVGERDAQRLAFAGCDVRPVLARRGKDGERDGLNDRNEERTRGVGEPTDLGHRLEQSEEARVGDDHTGDRTLRVGE